MLGKEIARLADMAEAEAIKRFPHTAVICRTCAFRSGTVPNGCLQTVMDAIKCVMEQVDFMCHEDISRPCMGWIECASRAQRKPIQTPWEFSE